jgi:hypothetical protein
MRDVVPDPERRIRRLQDRDRRKGVRTCAENNFCRSIDQVRLQSSQQDQVSHQFKT